MSMPIQRQSEQFGYFDDGPRFARDRSSTDLPRGLAALVNTSGPRIQAGMLNTRSAGFTMGDSPFSPGWGPRDHGGRGPDGGPMHPPSYYNDEDSPEDDDEEYFDPDHDPDRFIPESQVDPRTAAYADEEYYLDCPHCGGGTFSQDIEYGDCPNCGEEILESDVDSRTAAIDPDLRARYAAHIGSRHPFDRTAGAWEDTFGEDSPSPFSGDPERFFTDWLERGAKPGENEDPRDREDAMSRTAACLECGGDVLPNGGDWEHVDGPSDHDAEPDQDDYDNDDYGMGRDPARAMDEFKSRREGRRVALTPQDPAMAPQMPVGGGFLPGHRVGLDWRDRTIPGTVIANDGQVHIRWDEGQYTSEDPTEVRLL